MSGGRFLVSLREVLNTERILTCQSLLKENINFWKEDLKPVQKNYNSILLDILAQHTLKKILLLNSSHVIGHWHEDCQVLISIFGIINCQLGHWHNG